MVSLEQKTCACGIKFTGAPQKRKCSRNCGRDINKARTSKRQQNDLEFIAVDGEGVERPDGKHEYIMLSVGKETLANVDGSELRANQIFTFLYDQFLKHPRAAFIGFFLGYDFNMWLKKLTMHEVSMLQTKQGRVARERNASHGNHEPFPVYVDHGRWEIDMLGKNRFRLSPHEHSGSRDDPELCNCGESIDIDLGDENVSWDAFDQTPDVTSRKRDAKRMYICDTGPFWQTSFMSVIDPKGWPNNPVVTDEEYAILKRGKDKRGVTADYGDTSYLIEMREYNLLENEVLARVTKVLNEGFVSIGLKVPAKEWYGPGRPAQIWLNTHEGISHEDMERSIPEWAIKAARDSYYGGWFEQFMHGNIKLDVYEYDINSAYPYIISTLPCLIHGTWNQGTSMPTYDRNNLYLLNIQTSVQPSDTGRIMGGLPHRSPKGHITHPLITKGWYWKHEIDAAINAELIDSYTVSEYVEYVPCDCPPPLGDIADLYGKRIGLGLDLTDDERNALKDSPQGKAYKCVYNSSYGKFAQSIGHPRYGNPIYASLITAGCRAMILNAIATHPMKAEAVTMIATDGVYFTSPHPMETNKYELGGWDFKIKKGMTQFMPGIYWDDSSRKSIQEKKSLKLKSRGISAVDLANSMSILDDMYKKMERLPRTSTYMKNHVPMMTGTGKNEKSKWPTLDIKIRFSLTSCLQAIMQKDWTLAGKITHGGKRTIDSNPKTKRHSQFSYYDDNGNMRTHPYTNRGATTPYNKSFGFHTEEREILALMREMSGLLPDGEIDNLLKYVIDGSLSDDE